MEVVQNSELSAESEPAGLSFIEAYNRWCRQSAVNRYGAFNAVHCDFTTEGFDETRLQAIVVHAEVA